jgi:hypothetical protein
MFYFYIPEGICFAAFVARGYTMHVPICVFVLVFVSFFILLCVFACFPEDGHVGRNM